MRGDVLERLEPILDEPERRTSPVRGHVVGDERTQILALVDAGLLAVDGCRIEVCCVCTTLLAC